MGENDITLGPGALFIKHPDDLDWQPLGTVLDGSVEYHEAPEDVPEVVKHPELVELSGKLTLDPGLLAKWNEAVVELGRALAEALRPAIEVFGEIARIAAEAVPAICDGLSNVSIWLCAYSWACEAHPEWVNILNRTKKRRTRKKYQDRIMRAYMEE